MLLLFDDETDEEVPDRPDVATGATGVTRDEKRLGSLGSFEFSSGYSPVYVTKVNK